MKTGGMQAKKIGGKRYTDYDKQDLSVLADARRWLNRHGLKRFDLDEEERAHRAEIGSWKRQASSSTCPWCPTGSGDGQALGSRAATRWDASDGPANDENPPGMAPGH